MLVAIVGGSGAGKTWLADALSAELGPGVGRISLDDFYRDRSSLSAGMRARVNFDHPRAIDWPLFEQVLATCAAGRETYLPRYDFSTHSRTRERILLAPAALVLVDGLWLLRRPAVRRLFQYSIFLDCTTRVRLERRLARDQISRGRSKRSVLAQFRCHVDPMHRRFVDTQKRWATLVLAAPEQAGRVALLAKVLRSLMPPVDGLPKSVDFLKT
jgi:uridine kinase